MKIILTIALATILAGCGGHRDVQDPIKDFKVKPLNLKVGECVHIGNSIYRVTVVGEDSYGLMVSIKPPSLENFYAYPKADTDTRGVKTDCFSSMQEGHLKYLKSLKASN